MNENGPLNWSDAHILGYAPMDQIHEEFVQLIARLQAARDDELPELLGAMEEHLQAHFGEENAWMRNTDFPPRDCHIEQHDAVLKSVHEVQELLAQGNTEVCRALVQALADWFPNHATHLDSALAHWLCKRRLGGKPIILRRSISSNIICD
ncbi:bacteriohemerythrin [Noviherbaspirillum sp. Root189]|uniref:bacteriohemerythrin n=1 Tax=Noviherbaspirillum sp. Root189 TaxID=1736487 RepID=UPI000710F041|nr:hemerythrin domain-containing protein [Noviherbaspirillum sp. Root189]KRB87439.1 hemerythrin [Noviherbaspirillum sp. Root189]